MNALSELCVYFDLIEVGFSGLSDLFFTSIAVVALIFVSRFGGAYIRILTRFMAVFLTFWVGVGVYQSGGELRELRSAYKKESYKIVEGVIENFVPSKDEKPESFEVSGYHFKLYPFRGDFSFHQVRHQGSPLENGLYVRLWHYYGQIIRLEVNAPQGDCST